MEFLWRGGATARTAGSLVGVNKSTPSYYPHRLRKLKYENDEDAGFLSGEVELNESYFGGRRKRKRGRRQNENAKWLLRQYFPKTMELVDVKLKEVLRAVDKLNSRPRKCLVYKTPYEVFWEHTGIDASMLLGYALIT